MICTTAESGLLGHVESRVGPITDVDQDERLTILLCRLSADADSRPGQEPIRGCVRAADFEPAHGAFGGDIVYLDRTLSGHREIRAVLAHELTHAAVFSAVNGQSVDLRKSAAVPAWLNEAIAHVVELQVCPDSPNLQRRFADFRRTPSRFPVVIPDEFSQLAARRGAARAAGCSFLTATLEGHPNMRLSDLTRGGSSGSDGSGGSGDGVRILESAACTGFAELFRDWTVTLLKNDPPDLEFSLSDQVVISLTGTSFTRFSPAIESGVLTLVSRPEARLQVTIVEDAPAATTSVAESH